MDIRRSLRDGSGFLVVGSLGLVAAGCLAMMLAASGRFLPYELSAIDLSPADLCGYAGCRVNGFMAHDRAAWGGALVAIGVQYLHLALGPLRRGFGWAWWLLAVSAVVGVTGFLAFLGYGYLDPWHAAGTVVLAVLFGVGLARARRLRRADRRVRADLLPSLSTRAGLGRAILLAGAAGVAVAGLEILHIGATSVFVAEDIGFMGVDAHALHALDPRLVPFIAHDRASFGAAVLVTGLTAFVHLWCAEGSRAMWAAILVAGTVSLGAAISTHVAVGYLNAWHLAPPVVGAVALVVGLALAWPSRRPTASVEPA